MKITCRQCFCCRPKAAETTSGVVIYGVCDHIEIDRKRFPEGMLIGRDFDIQPWLCPKRQETTGCWIDGGIVYFRVAGEKENE